LPNAPAEPRARTIAAGALSALSRVLGAPLCLLGRIVGATFVLHEVLDRAGAGIDRGFAVPLADTLVGAIDEERAPLVRADLAESHGDPRTAAFERELGMRSAMVLPLVLRDGSLGGAIVVLDRARREFSAEDVQLGADLARAASVEIDDGLRVEHLLEVERARMAGLLARGLAHDFGNIISSALANLKSLARIVGAQPEAAEPIEEMAVSLEAARELVSRLRDVGRSDSAATKRRGIDPVALASKVVALARGVFRGAGASVPWIDLRLVPPDLPLEIRGDEHALEQALLNLVLNARDAVRERGGRVTVRVMHERFVGVDAERPWRRPGEWALLAVDDDGPGISAEARARIFEPGFTTKGERGSGLGLFLVATTAAAHGGGVIAASSPEGGARVALCLPTERRGSSISLRPPMVLVADDERGLRRACARELLAAGLGVAEAASRAAALEIVEADPERIVAAIIDRDLGDGSGQDVARRLRELNASAVVFETSGGAHDDPAVIEKPFDLPALVRRVLEATRASARGA
jgi:signal transduction histidine kinase/CheY-like chemotaxis protein